MPGLSFELSSATHSYATFSETEELSHVLAGKHQDCEDRFEVHLGNESWCALNAPVSVEILRKAAQDDNQIALETEGNENFIQLNCPSSHDEQPSIFIRIQLPAEVYQRILAIDWTKEAVWLNVMTRSNPEDPLSYLYDSDPNGGDQVWVADRGPEQRIDTFDLTIQSLPMQRISLSEISTTDEGGNRKDTHLEALMSNSLQRIIDQNEDLHKNRMLMTWLILSLLILILVFK